MKLISVNIEGRKHWDLLDPFFDTEQSDVICMQEVWQTDAERFAAQRSMHYAFAPMLLKHVDDSDPSSPLEPWGVAMFSHVPLSNVRIEYYYMAQPELVLE